MSLRGLTLPRHIPPRVSAVELKRVHSFVFSDGPGEFVPYFLRLVTLTALSAALATFGLIENSTAVVIGAMLVSPLMQPIIGFAAALVAVDRKRQLVSVGLIIVAALESVAVAAVIAAVAPNFSAVTITPEILQRTGPGILDLAIACAAGAAGAYVTVRHLPVAAFPGAAIPGAAIAVALMPPLAALGILVEGSNGTLANGALLLFVTNLLGIIVASVLVLWLSGYATHRRLSRSDWLAVAIPIVAAIAIALPLEQQSASAFLRARDEALVRRLILPSLRLQGLGIQGLTIVEQHRSLAVSIDVAGPQQPQATSGLAQQLAGQLHREVTLIVRWTQRTEVTEVAGPTSS